MAACRSVSLSAMPCIWGTSPTARQQREEQKNKVCSCKSLSADGMTDDVS
eukprot:m.525699 g.525699  ORF g.525699 m.525699 type:complete len:50 (-) comp173876_c0_seq1:217-366(-)